MQTTKRLYFPIEVILVCIRWYAAYPLSYRHIEEMMGKGKIKIECRKALLFYTRRKLGLHNQEVDNPGAKQIILLSQTETEGFKG